MKYDSSLDLIHHTPLVRLRKIEEKYHLESSLYAKLEGMNLGGSSKSRIARSLIEKGMLEGKINANTKIVEVSSGNTAISLSLICAYYHLSFIAIMPENVSLERKKLIEIYGGKVILTPASLGMKGSIEKLQELIREEKNIYVVDQFHRKENVITHQEKTGEELLDDLPQFDYLIAGIGTGGTLIGTQEVCKRKNPQLFVIGVEPEESPLLSLHEAHPHRIQGIGANFIPPLVEASKIDKIERSSFESAKKKVLELAREEGIFVGFSSGAVLDVALRIAKATQHKKFVLIFPDFGERYLSCYGGEEDERKGMEA